MKRNIIWNILFTLIFLVLLAAEGLALYAVIRLNMLPLGYLIGLIAILALFSLGIGLLLLKGGKGRSIIGCVLALLLICGCGVITTVANDVVATLESTNQATPQETTREIYVLVDNEVQDLAETGKFTFGYVKSFDEFCAQQVVEEITAQVQGPVATAGYTNLFAMVNALVNEQIDAMILNGAYVDILEETEGYEMFSTKVRILAQVEVEEPEMPLTELPEEEEEPAEQTKATEETLQPEETEPVEEEVDFKDLKPFIVYVSGSDGHSAMLKTGRSDVNILAAVNPMTKQVLLLNTPRDYYVRNTAGGGARDKLTHCGMYGISCSMNTLGNLYDEPIEYYVQINFTGFKKLIDALGGITVNSDYAFTAITRTYISKGENHLTGQQALDFARERYTLRGGDNERGKHQMQVIEAVIKKATSGTTIISNYSSIMESIEGMFTMNIPSEMISKLMKMQLTDMAQWNVVSYAVTGTNASEECYTLPGMKLSVIKPSDASVAKGVRLIDMVFAGELLTEEVVNSMT